MDDDTRRVRQVRIDVPLRTTYAYLFVDSDQVKWNPWWGTLYAHLLSLAPHRPAWEYEPLQDVFVARAELSDEHRTSLMRFLRSAPVREISEHRTLRRAVELTSEQERRLKLMYFSAGK